jgi:hypothetical protein
VWSTGRSHPLDGVTSDLLKTKLNAEGFNRKKGRRGKSMKSYPCSFILGPSEHLNTDTMCSELKCKLRGYAIASRTAVTNWVP